MIAYDARETDRFGIRCARVTDLHAPLKEIDGAARGQNIKFLSARIATDDISRLQDYEEAGFRLMDTLVYYHADLRHAPPKPVEISGVSFRPATATDAEAVGAIAADAFAGFFGHFHADRRLSKADANAVYVDWAKTSVTSAEPDLPVLVAVANERLIGFVSTRRPSANVGEIMLNAVCPAWQGKGVYGGLLDRSMLMLKTAGLSEVITSTQLNNIAVQRAWARRGLRVTESYYTLHKWCETAPVE